MYAPSCFESSEVDHLLVVHSQTLIAVSSSTSFLCIDLMTVMGPYFVPLILAALLSFSSVGLTHPSVGNRIITADSVIYRSPLPQLNMLCQIHPLPIGHTQAAIRTFRSDPISCQIALILSFTVMQYKHGLWSRPHMRATP